MTILQLKENYLHTAYLLLGSNMGDSLKNLEQATWTIKEQIGRIEKLSSIYQTAAWGNENQADFYNQVLKVSTQLSAESLLNRALQIELSLGRKRFEKWGERIIDIDILYYNDLSFTSKDLVLPHPQLHLRKFTLVPLCELDADFLHPVLLKTNQNLLDELQDQLQVVKLESFEFSV